MRTWSYKIQWGSDGSYKTYGKVQAETKEEALAWIASWFNYEALVLWIR